MKILIQRVKSAHVKVGSETVGQINQGLLVFLGVAKTDTQAQADFLVDKLISLRIFDDAEGKMNLALTDVKAEVLVVSQFTLYGQCDKGRRPSFDQAADPALAESLYEYFISKVKQSGISVQTGKFRAMMDVALINDGPVTFLIERL